MKFRTILASAALVLLALAGCKKEEDFGPEALSISCDPEIELAQEGEEITIQLNSTVEWGIRGYTDEVKSWLSITPESGDPSKSVQTITIKALANSETDRSASLIFFGNVLCKAPLTISQKGAKGDGMSLTVADFIAKADTGNEYRLTGTVSGFSSTYCSFDLTDATGSIYVYSVTNKDEWVDKISNGGTVTLRGTYKYYSSKSQDEVVDATIESFTPAETVDYSKCESKTVAEFIEAANTTTYFKLKGTVSGYNSTYCSFDLTDDTGTIYVYSTANKADWADKISNGGTVELAGLYLYYESKQQHEVVQAQIISFTAGEGGGSGTDYSKCESKTVAEFIAAANTSTYYKLKGKVSSYNSNYCSFDLTDDTGTIYVYSTANKADWSSKISDGGTVELAGLYSYYSAKSQHEVVQAQILSFTAAEGGDGGDGGNGGGEGGGTVEGNTTTFNTNSSAQTWSTESDSEYGAGYSSTTSGIKVGYYQYKSSTAAVSAKDDHIRVYKYYAFSVTAAEGKKISKVVITTMPATSSSSYCFDLTPLVGGGTATADTDALTITWTPSEPVNRIVAQAAAGQVRIKSMAVTYAE